jgi:hypothetical protein
MNAEADSGVKKRRLELLHKHPLRRGGLPGVLAGYDEIG